MTPAGPRRPSAGEAPPLRGLFLPVTTPFREDGGISPERLLRQLEIYRGFPLSGIVLFGTSGEGPLLDPGEEPALLAASREAVPAAWHLIVQVGRESVRATVAAAARAEAAGATALLCLPPRYYATGPEVVAAYFRALRVETALPILAYHIPQRSRVDLPADLLLELAAEGTLAGVKDSAGDLALQARLRQEAGGGFAVLNGKGSVTERALRAGADGAILAIADAAPEPVAALFEAHTAGDVERAERIQRALSPLAECCGRRYGVAGIKAALDLRGWPGGGPTRAPLAPLGEIARAEVARALRAAGVEPAESAAKAVGTEAATGTATGAAARSSV
ncbi:MAG TPA: dihydrodipicolinate synthase family protein [Gemmatimonadota bacterium]|nr:dihydrodipicolinate synthase family protein [Gemmatimonadota bacterium]